MSSNVFGQALDDIFNYFKQDELEVAGPDLLNFINAVSSNPTDNLGNALQLGKVGSALLADEETVATQTAQFALGLVKTALTTALAAVQASASSSTTTTTAAAPAAPAAAAPAPA